MRLITIGLIATMMFLGFNGIYVIDDNNEVTMLDESTPVAIKSAQQVTVAVAEEDTHPLNGLYVVDDNETETAQQMIISDAPLYTEDTRKPRVIVMTDGEGDDRASMVRFLYYVNDMDVEGLIYTNSKYQKEGHSPNTDEPWLALHVAAYGKIVNKLRVHDRDYPSESYLAERIYIGDENPEHLSGVPPFKDTPGSERIIQVLLDEDPRPVWVQAWGGTNTLGQSLYKLKYSGQYSAEDYAKAASKLRLYSVSDQDNSLDYIVKNFKEVLVIKLLAYSGTWDYFHDDGPLLGEDWVSNNIEGHGPLADWYRKSTILEGDTPALLNMIDNGLRADEEPWYGGWGGRFQVIQGNYYGDASEDGDIKIPIIKYIEAAQNSFQARLDWGLYSNFRSANHPPSAKATANGAMYARLGTKVTLDASDSYDIDGNALKYQWFHQWQSDATSSPLALTSSDVGKKVTITIPSWMKEGDTIHLILEVTDDGSPALKDYHRVVITVIE